MADMPGRNILVEKYPHICGYTFIFLLIIPYFITELKTFLFSFLFLYLISDFITNDIRKYVKFIPKAVLFSIMYVLVIVFIIILAYMVIPNIIKQLPTYMDQIQTAAIKNYEFYNNRYNLEQYIDPQEVQATIIKASTVVIGFMVGQLKSFYTTFFYFIIALVINLLFYHDTSKIDGTFLRNPESLLGFLYKFTRDRVSTFYHYFKMVMGGQLVISAINTAITALMIFMLGLPNAAVLILLVFLFGLLPIIGNLISNTILTATALATAGVFEAAMCLGLLVGIHKLEYFLNSKIIGDIVKLPMTVTLFALVIVEIVLGAFEMILAIPLVLFLRHEMEHIPGLKSQPSDRP